MNLRSYRDEDYETVCDFLIELNRKDRTHINWNWARFEWMMEHPEYELCGNASVEWYDCVNGEKTDPDYHSAIWVPVKRKE